MTQDIQIYIDNFRVDIATTSAIQIKRQFKDVKEFSKKKTSFSKPITVLYTQNNAAIFGAAFNINQVGGWDKNSRPIARIVINGSTMPLDAAKLVSITSSGYSFTVYKSETNLDTLFGSELIKGNADSSKDISFTNQYTFNFTRPNLRTLMQSAPRQDGKGINYGYADLLGYGIDDDSDYQYDRLFVPSIAARELLENTLLSVGKTVTFSSDIETYLNKLYIPYNGDISALQNSWKYFKAHLNTIVTQDAIKDRFGDLPLLDFVKDYDKILDDSNATAPSPLPFNKEVDFGKYQIKLTINAGSLTDRELYPKIRVGVGSNIELLETLSPTTSQPKPSMNLVAGANNLDTFIANFEVDRNPDSVGLYISYNVSDPDGPGYQVTSPDTIFELTKIDALYNEDQVISINANDILPIDYKKIDLFNDIVTIFNASVTSDGDAISIVSANEFNRDVARKVHDWTKKIAESNIELSTLLSKKQEILSYEMLDSDDIYNEDYNDKFDSNIHNLERSEANKTTVSKSLKFANTNRIGNFSVIAKDEYNTALKPRMLFCNSANIGAMRFGEDNNGSRDTAITNLHILSNRFKEDTTATDNLILAFNNEFSYSGSAALRKGTNGTIYNRFHANDNILMTSDDSMILETEFNLTPKDVEEVNFNDIIFIKTEKYGSLHYRLNEITNFRTGTNKLTKVELVEIDLDVLDSADFASSEIDLKSLTL